MITYFLRRF